MIVFSSVVGLFFNLNASHYCSKMDFIFTALGFELFL